MKPKDLGHREIGDVRLMRQRSQTDCQPAADEEISTAGIARSPVFFVREPLGRLVGIFFVCFFLFRRYRSPNHDTPEMDFRSFTLDCNTTAGGPASCDLTRFRSINVNHDSARPADDLTFVPFPNRFRESLFPNCKFGDRVTTGKHTSCFRLVELYLNGRGPQSPIILSKHEDTAVAVGVRHVYTIQSSN